MGDIGPEQLTNLAGKQGVVKQDAAKRAAFHLPAGQTGVRDADLAAALAMIAALPLSTAEKAQAVRRLMASKGGLPKATPRRAGTNDHARHKQRRAHHTNVNNC
jgi:hypothetical protein